jgi:PAS domain-containing protein
MRRFLALPIRVHLLLLVCLLTLPALAGIVHMGLDQRRDSFDDSVAEMTRLASVMAIQQRSLIANAQQLGNVIAKLPDVKQHNTVAVNKILKDIINIYPQHHNILIADRAGNVWASALPLNVPNSIGDRRHFRNARSTGRFSSGEYAIGRITGKPLLNFAYPRFDARGKFDGVVGLTFNPDFFDRFNQEAGLPKGSAYYIFDHRGVVIYSSQRAVRQIGHDDREDLFRRMHDGPDEETFVDFGLDGVKRIIAYRKLRLAGEQFPCLYIRASTPLKAAEVLARRAQLHNVLLLFPFFGVAVVLALLVSKYCFVDRIGTLRRAVQRVAAGDLEVQVAEMVSGGELGELGLAFDGMARQLAAREKARQAAVHELLESKKKYQTIFKGATDAIFVHPIREDGLAGKFVEVNDRACEHLGYSKKELLRLSPADIDSPPSGSNYRW